MKNHENATKTAKSVFKKWWFWMIIFVIIIGAYGGAHGTNDDKNKSIVNNSSNTETNNIETNIANKETNSLTNSEDESNVDDTLPSDIIFNKNVGNDKSGGHWRLAKTATTKQTEDYILAYYNKYFNKNEQEVHVIINSTYRTTTLVTEGYGKLYVRVYEYTDKEEHDCKKIGTGQKLKEYCVDESTGEIENIPEE